jgi:hypothetical protein
VTAPVDWVMVTTAAPDAPGVRYWLGRLVGPVPGLGKAILREAISVARADGAHVDERECERTIEHATSSTEHITSIGVSARHWPLAVRKSWWPHYQPLKRTSPAVLSDGGARAWLVRELAGY